MISIGLVTKWLELLSLDDIDKIRNHLIANPIDESEIILVLLLLFIIIILVSGFR